MNQMRNWLFALTNPTQTGDELKEMMQAWPDIRYGIFQMEWTKAWPEIRNGIFLSERWTSQFRGYVQFKKPKRFTALLALLPEAHWAGTMYGTPEQVIAKIEWRVDGPWTFGEPQSQGQCTDLAFGDVTYSTPTTFVRNNIFTLEGIGTWLNFLLQWHHMLN